MTEPANTKKEGLLAFEGGDIRPPVPALAFWPSCTLAASPSPSASPGSSSLAVQLGDWCPVRQNKSPAAFEVLLSPIFESSVEPSTTSPGVRQSLTLPHTRSKALLHLGLPV